jgi:hypothetical protein
MPKSRRCKSGHDGWAVSHPTYAHTDMCQCLDGHTFGFDKGVCVVVSRRQNVRSKRRLLASGRSSVLTFRTNASGCVCMLTFILGLMGRQLCIRPCFAEIRMMCSCKNLCSCVLAQRSHRHAFFFACLSLVVHLLQCSARDFGLQPGIQTSYMPIQITRIRSIGSLHTDPTSKGTYQKRGER